MNMEVDHELETNISRKEFRVLLLHEFRLNHKATEAANNICSTMGMDVLSIRTVQHWFNRFKSGRFELDDSPHTGRPMEVVIDLLKQLIEGDLRLTSRCVSRATGMLPYYSGKTFTRIT